MRVYHVKENGSLDSPQHLTRADVGPRLTCARGTQTGDMLRPGSVETDP